MTRTLTAVPDEISVEPEPAKTDTPQLRVVSEGETTQSSFAPLFKVLRLFLFATPFLLVSVAARDAGLFSSDHARLMTEALALHRDPALTSIDFTRPPLLVVLFAIWPNPVLVQYLSALIGGAVASVLWSQLKRSNLPLWLRAALVLSFCATPSVLLVAGMHVSDMLALLLLLLAWRSYSQFVHHGVTWHGFVSGLLLGLAFFSSFLTLLFVIPFALGAPALGSKESKSRHHAVIAGIVVIAFPGLCALGSWIYLSWLSTGHITHLFTAFANAGSASHPAPSIWSLVQTTGQDLLRQPLYVLVAFLMASRGLRQLVAHLFPLILVTVPRAFGWQYDEGFVSACYIGFAVLGLAVLTAERPHRTTVHINKLLLSGLTIAVAAQITAAIALPLRTTEPRAWQTAITGSNAASIATSRQEQALANELATQPQGVVLTDYNASQIIARAGTTFPFLLPASDQFIPAVWNPAHVVDHILLPVTPNPRDNSGLEDVRNDGSINGFHLDTTQAGWVLYTRNGMPNLSS